ncbi:organic solvent ABC transporter permease [Marinobacter halodurans]|uniref:Organic solvent ABC transporter permease n=1 Tax=Marinobacter halodurans TaxID=2528979 RepID=A0ABY1ZS37_9GAMM|nr:organic solvent ABC transporter permease [Marinobacter halodurans]TBW59097.1 organic solvent ABC transporter permease [Marinobacter halodurans]
MNLKPFLLLAPLALIQGCGGGDGGDDTATGQLTLSGIQGLSYQTRSQTGTTDARGRFHYYAGETLTLSVGNLPLVSGVPADEVVTPLEFLPETRRLLDNATVDDLGLLSHRPAEQQAIANTTLRNMTRFLLALDEDGTTADSNQLVFTDRVISQLNAALSTLDQPIDFTVPESQFINEVTEDRETTADADLTPANRLLKAICFYPEGDELCEDPPTQADIDAAPTPPENGTARDPDVVYSDELESKRNRILNAIRKVEDIDSDDIDEYLTSELDRITTDIANEYYLSQVTQELPASDTAIHEVTVRRVGQKVSLESIEAISTDENALVVHSYSAQTHSAEYFIDGEAGDDAELIVNFKPDDDYRWLRKPLRVVIQ